MANRKEYPAPKFRDLKEEDKYWQSHSPMMEGYEGHVQKEKQNRSSFLSVRLTDEELSRLREVAAQYGIGPSTYLRQLLIQSIEYSGQPTLPPALLLNLCRRLRPEQKEEDLERLHLIYRQYLQMQERMADEIAALCVSNILGAQEKLQNKSGQLVE
ncbi:MAG: hypothetical protein V1771_02330 [Chloroflexota bacterium]